jgi:hypothetical protein
VTISVFQPASMREWAEHVDGIQALTADTCAGRYLSVDSARSIECQSPLCLTDPADERFFFGKPAAQFNRSYGFSETYVAALPHARLVGPGYVVVSHDRCVVSDSYSGEHVLQEGGRFLATRLNVRGPGEVDAVPIVLLRETTRPRPIDQPCVAVAHYWHFNYHHWLIDCLPRLRPALDEPALNDALVLVPNRLTGFQQDSLALFGIPGDRLHRFDGNDDRFDTLYFPSIGNFSPSELAWVRGKLGCPDHRTSDARGGLFYISRGDASSRRVTNEAEVIDFLRPFGFEVLHLDGMPLRAQIEHFASARLVVGPHGAGLTNIIFGPRDMILLELAPRDEINHCFWLLANALGQRYAFLSGQPANASRDFHIELDRLDQALRSAMEHLG